MNNHSALFRVTAYRQQAIKWTSDTHVRPLRTMSYTCGYLCTELHCIAPGWHFFTYRFYKKLQQYHHHVMTVETQIQVANNPWFIDSRYILKPRVKLPTIMEI